MLKMWFQFSPLKKVFLNIYMNNRIDVCVFTKKKKKMSWYYDVGVRTIAPEENSPPGQLPSGWLPPGFLPPAIAPRKIPSG